MMSGNSSFIVDGKFFVFLVLFIVRFGGCNKHVTMLLYYHIKGCEGSS